MRRKERSSVRRQDASDLQTELDRLRAEILNLRKWSNEAIAQRNRLIFDHVEGWAEAGSLWNYLLERGMYDAAIADMPENPGRHWMERQRKLENVTGHARLVRRLFPDLYVLAPEFNAFYSALDSLENEN